MKTVQITSSTSSQNWHCCSWRISYQELKKKQATKKSSQIKDGKIHSFTCNCRPTAVPPPLPRKTTPRKLGKAFPRRPRAETKRKRKRGKKKLNKNLFQCSSSSNNNIKASNMAAAQSCTQQQQLNHVVGGVTSCLIWHFWFLTHLYLISGRKEIFNQFWFKILTWKH